MNVNEFKCSVCDGEFKKTWSDEAAWAEQAVLWPGFSLDECSITCDDCHKKIFEWAIKRRP